MKNFFKMGCLGFIVLIVIIIVIAVATGGNDSSNKANTSNSTKQETNKKDAKNSYGVGDAVEVGDMVYTVNSKEVTSQVGPSVLPTEAKGKFLVVELNVKNNGNKAVTVDSSFFKLKHGDKVFEADSAASMSANQGEDGNIKNSFFLEQLNPDLEMGGKVVFDLSESTVNASDLQLQVQTGAFGTQTEVINLQ
ncbi:DUF4352 domain-containing protein [Priestia filamentosa]|uniref:Uncharacterized protein n=1 Tax=Priestia filamentosa TaxID=1402861 RepID=A0A0H4KI98_9BACI|nr:DUF4352 domain-containing protein [Priestia filamentosa]AKO92536.1 hypothetical protein BEH_10815 [Priestia filamentosa]MDT3762608.1 DUF4352 domain-containing protein [Priestia filamentosa]WRU97074.1 DUF4352 domain-containing protein [Priestia filamentosa]SMF28779.1 protein of unknown function [Priestia filamentosa]